ncbi:MAG: glycosyltransferase family 2 protein [Arenibacter sp.]
MTPDFSIITVAFNSEKTIERTIKSVLNQTYKNYEYIIIDGGSTDKTNEIISKYKKEFSGGITHISEPDKGIYDAMNKGIALTRGKVIGLLNSDDYYFDNTLAIVHDAYINSDKNAVLTGNMIFKSDIGEQLLKNSEKRLKRKFKYFKNGVRHPATFLPKVIYDKVGLFNVAYKIAADAELMLRIFKAKYVFKFIDRPLLIMADGGISNSKGIVRQTVLEKSYILKSYCPNAFLRFLLMAETRLRFKVKELASGLTTIYRKIENH